MSDEELRLLREMRNLAWGWKPNRWLHADEQALFESVKELLERGGLSAARGGEHLDFRDAYQQKRDDALRQGLKEDAAHEIGLYAVYLTGKAAGRV